MGCGYRIAHERILHAVSSAPAPATGLFQNIYIENQRPSAAAAEREGHSRFDQVWVIIGCILLLKFTSNNKKKKHQIINLYTVRHLLWAADERISIDNLIHTFLNWLKSANHSLVVRIHSPVLLTCFVRIRSDSSDHLYLNDILTLLWAKTFLGLKKYERTNRQYRWRCWNTRPFF
jgi:hypothetical protein